MKTFYWFKTCPFCNQGRLFIYKNITDSKLYLHCEECERGYYDPQKIDAEHSFLTLSEDFDAVVATADDVKTMGWEGLDMKFVVK